jgi:phosphomethylpyrimidine synthase
MTIIEKIERGEEIKILQKIAQEEGTDVQKLSEKILNGNVVVPHNPLHPKKELKAIGEGLSTKVNANVGTSEDFPEISVEKEKLKVAVEAGADAVMDLSTGGDIKKIRQELLANSPVPFGTVPIYEAAVRARERKGNIVYMSAEDMFSVVEEQAEEGVDFMTIHAGVTQRTLEVLRKQSRAMGVVSRGGTFLLAWMIHHERENPFFENFDRLLEIAKEYDVTISLGDGFRPGSVIDASDRPQFEELIILGELVERAREAKVQVMVEGPGHLPLDHIESNMKIQKSICKGAPFYVLGPVVTDVAPGYDHLVSAIGGALAAYLGADFLCYVTPREHLGLPTPEDVREGVIAARIAAHAADLAKGLKKAWKWDEEMAKARKELDWKKQLKLAIDTEKAESLWKERRVKEEEGCSMCGDFCALKLLSDYLELPFPERC